MRAKEDGKETTSVNSGRGKQTVNYRFLEFLPKVLIIQVRDDLFSSITQRLENSPALGMVDVGDSDESVDINQLTNFVSWKLGQKVLLFVNSELT